MFEDTRRRVAALWAYHQTLAELDSRLTALHTLERSLTLAPELDALVQQIGADQIATDRIAGHIEETRALTTQVEQLVHVLQSTLAPRTVGEIDR